MIEIPELVRWNDKCPQDPQGFIFSSNYGYYDDEYDEDDNDNNNDNKLLN